MLLQTFIFSHKCPRPTKMTILASISTFIKSKTSYDFNIGNIAHNLAILTLISTLVKFKTNYDVDITDIIHKLAISLATFIKMQDYVMSEFVHSMNI